MKRGLTLLALLAMVLSACSTLTSPTPAAVEPTTTPTPTFTLIPTPTAQPTPLGQIAFASERNGKFQIMIMNADGSSETSLTADYGEYSRPAWSPDGTRLALRVETGSGSGIALMDVRQRDGVWVGLKPFRLVDAFADSPRWSPEGTQIIYVATGENSSWRTYVINAVGSSPVLVPGIPEHATDVDWSPDGQYIVFSVYDDQAKQIDDLYIIQVDGAGLTRLTNTPTINESGASWSPDGKRIVFSAYQTDEQGNGNSDIYWINSDGTDLTRVTTNPEDDFDPTWSPDGTQIAFVSTRNAYRDNNYEIYVINDDGTGEMRLTHNDSVDRWPTWRSAQQGATTPACQSAGEFTADVTIPAGTRFAVPQEFTKVWRLKNSGTCTWTPAAYSLRFVEGEQMGEISQIMMPGAIQPGATVDLALPLTAPETSGLHTGKWILYDRAAQPVPASDGNPLTLTVTIEVLSPDQTLLSAPLYFLSEKSGSQQIWRMETNASTLTQITFENSPVLSYDLSPADASVAYVSQGQVFLVDRNGANRQPIVNLGEVQYSNVTWSPDGQRLAYGLGGVHVYDKATAQDRLLIANVESDFPSITIYQPLSWSPDGSQLLVSIGLWESAEIGILSVENSTLLARAPLEDMYAWRNDSQAFFLASSEFPMMVGIEPGLWLVSARKDLQPLVKNAFVWWPFQRADGKLMYFMGPSSNMDIQEYSITLMLSAEDGSGQTVLRDQPLLLNRQDALQVYWSSDGNYFVAQILRGRIAASEILLFPADNNLPFFLMQTGEDFKWER